MIKVNNLSKTFNINRVKALDSMDIDIIKGEIHGIAGDNGAGKSTLVKIIHGICTWDQGSVEIKGKTAMVSQHFHLIPHFTILENIIIGNEPRKFIFFTDFKKAEFKINSILKIYNFSLNLDTMVSELSLGQKQLVEIIKAIYNNSEIIIFDEPTSVLNDLEARKLRDTLISLKKNGKTIVIISHKILDIHSLCDRFTIMKKGRNIGTFITKEITTDKISILMSGSDNPNIMPVHHSKGDVIFTLEEFGISLREGEIIGFTGYGECGLELLEKKMEELSITSRDIGFVPGDRLNKGVDINSPIYINLGLSNLKNFTNFGIVSHKRMKSWSKKIIAKYKIIGNPGDHTGLLSGGNIQKTSIARVLENSPRILVLSSPTWGIDIESSRFIYSQIDLFRKKGHGIILLSHDIEEILLLTDNFHVFYKGQIIKSFNNSQLLNKDDIGKALAGII